jgi:hypothetical protein
MFCRRAVPPPPCVCSTNVWTNYETAVDVAIRDASYKPDPKSKGVWPSDKQGYSLISHADTAENWAKHQKQWVKHETTFTAPSDTVSLLELTAQHVACQSRGSCCCNAVLNLHIECHDAKCFSCV